MSATAAFIFGLLLPSAVIFAVIYLISLKIDRGLKAVSLYLLIVGAYLLSKNISNALTFFITGVLVLLSLLAFKANKKTSKVMAVIFLILLLTFPIYAYLSSNGVEIKYKLDVGEAKYNKLALEKERIVKVNYTIINKNKMPVKSPYVFLCSSSHPIYSEYKREEKVVWDKLEDSINIPYYSPYNETIEVCFKYKEDYTCEGCLKAKKEN